MSERNWEAYGKSTYQWHVGHKKYLRVTKSSLTSDFTFCQKQYEYKRIEGRKSPETDDMLRGTNVHDAIEEFYVLARPVYRKAYEALKKGHREEALQMLLDCVPQPDEPYTLGEEPIIRQRIEWDLIRLEQDLDRFLPVINELEVHAFEEIDFEFDGETVTVPIHFAGSIDRGYENEDGTYTLMELKTGKWVGTDFKVRSMRTEMAFYTDLLHKADHPLKDVSHWGWFYPYGQREGVPRSENHVAYEKIKKRYISDTLKRHLRNLVEAYLTNNFMPQPSEGKCAWCEFVTECPAWQEGGDIYWKKPKPRIRRQENAGG